MSLNITPQITQSVVNAAAPSTEALARANAIKEVVPAPVQVEAAVPQKSREQDTRGPVADNPTYDDIINQSETSIIPDDPLAEQEQQEQQQGEQAQQQDAEEQDAAASDEQSQPSPEAEKRAEQAVEDAQRREVQQLARRDDEVRSHEQAHAAIGGRYAGAPRYQYETGPDGQKYAVAGEVSIDVSKAQSPQETIQKMQTVRAAALAPAEPSSQDRRVAAEASQKILEARAELIRENAEAISSSEDDGEVELNTESTFAEEPRKRSLAGENGVSEPEPANTATLAEPEAQYQTDTSREAQVVESRYRQSYQADEHRFNAVA